MDQSHKIVSFMIIFMLTFGVLSQNAKASEYPEFTEDQCVKEALINQYTLFYSKCNGNPEKEKSKEFTNHLNSKEAEWVAYAPGCLIILYLPQSRVSIPMSHNECWLLFLNMTVEQQKRKPKVEL